MKRIDVRYCKMWGYLPRAVRVAALIKSETGIEPQLVIGGRGEFAVSVEEEIVAKKDTGGFPADTEIVAAVRRALGPNAGT